MTSIVCKGIVVRASHFGVSWFKNWENTTYILSVEMDRPSIKDKPHVFRHYEYLFE